MLEIIYASTRLADKPEFSWVLKGDENQESYQIQVLNSKKQVFWDSGTVFSCNRHNIAAEKSIQKLHHGKQDGWSRTG